MLTKIETYVFIRYACFYVLSHFKLLYFTQNWNYWTWRSIYNAPESNHHNRFI